MKRSGEHWVLVAVALVIPVGLAAMGVFLEPDGRGFGTHEQLGLRPCTMMELWEVPCPGCGVTTSVTLAARGRLGDSLAAQPFGTALALASVVWSLWALATHLRGRDLWAILRRSRLGRIGATTLVLLVVSWIYKLLTV